MDASPYNRSKSRLNIDFHVPEISKTIPCHRSASLLDLSSQLPGSVKIIPWTTQNLGVLPPRPSNDIDTNDNEEGTVTWPSLFKTEQTGDDASSTSHEVVPDLPPPKQRRTSSKRLTRDQRRDILLMRRFGYKYQDIAKILGVTQSAVQYTINSGRASPEHHKAGRKKNKHAEGSIPASGRRIRHNSAELGEHFLGRPNTESAHSAVCPIPDEPYFAADAESSEQHPNYIAQPINALHPILD